MSLKRVPARRLTVMRPTLTRSSALRRIGLLASVILLLGITPAAAFAQSSEATANLSVLEAIILGLVEGLTEYLPVSSTGHLLVTNSLLGLNETEAGENAINTYAICIQIGAIAAVFFLYWDRIRQMLDGLLGRDLEGRRILGAVLVSFFITAVIGLTLVDFVKERLFGPTPIAVAWVVGGLVILGLSRMNWFEQAGAELVDLTLGQAAIIGVMQSIALWPGVSRSMITIIAAVLVGLTLRAAVEYSFLLGLITLSAATVKEGYEGGGELIDTFGWVTPLIGLVVAFVSAMAAVKWMVAWLNDRGFEVFGWYRVAVGLLAFVLIAAGAI